MCVLCLLKLFFSFMATLQVEHTHAHTHYNTHTHTLTLTKFVFGYSQRISCRRYPTNQPTFATAPLSIDTSTL